MARVINMVSTLSKRPIIKPDEGKGLRPMLQAWVFHSLFITSVDFFQFAPLLTPPFLCFSLMLILLYTRPEGIVSGILLISVSNTQRLKYFWLLGKTIRTDNCLSRELLISKLTSRVCEEKQNEKNSNEFQCLFLKLSNE